VIQATDSSPNQSSGWHPDLVALGYSDPLFVPSPTVQATIACVPDPSFHEFVQTTNKAAFADQDEEGVHAPLLLQTLDLSHWSALMNTVTADPNLGIA
jgi:hypothetical protein